MKRLRNSLIAILLLITTHGYGLNIFVSPNGSDLNKGTSESPMATLAAALRKVRDLRRLNDPSVNDTVHIILRGGLYKLDEPIFIRAEDNGTATSPTIIEATPGEVPVMSGGVQVKDWRQLKHAVPGLPATAIGKVWVTDLSSLSNDVRGFRQLWVNGNKAIRARDRNADSMNRILSWNKTEQTCWIPTPKTADLKKVPALEMFIHQWWAIAILRVKKIEQHGDSSKLFFHQPESRIQSEHPWPAPWISRETGNSAFYLSNAIQFLDQPGEWYFDISKQALYYWPRKNEDMNTAVSFVPLLETLLRMEGTVNAPVQHIHIQNISFQHTGWRRPSQQGHVALQVGMHLLDAYKLKMAGTPDKKTLENQAWIGRPSSAVTVSYAHHTSFTGCRFEHLGATALDHGKGTHNNKVLGNLFKDIGGNAILAGVFSDEAVETHLPYREKDDREICDSLQITSNLVTDAANEDWGAVAIGAGYVRNIRISHNEISDVSYTGISLGWGWTPSANVMRNNSVIRNRIHHYGKHMYDVAGIYTLSAQPGSVISENYISDIYKAPYAHIPSHWFYIYTDEGSSYFSVKDNLCPSEKFLQNANGPGNEWKNNGPDAGDSILRSAGLYPGFRYLGKERVIDSAWPINKEAPVMIELVIKNVKSNDAAVLKGILEKSRMDTSSLYQWQNHYVIFGKVQDVFLLKERIRKAFSTASLKSYDDLFYEFNRERCDDNGTVSQWDHVLLTANLVRDPLLQKQYLDQHANQFQKWPEVAKGFCNAKFQQLLLFRNGRQLMLVISIPKGNSLDALNPLTTKDNPKMNEWNNLMKKYQEGIPGTKKNEVWVFLSPVN
jgi:hypothetical protein